MSPLIASRFNADQCVVKTPYNSCRENFNCHHHRCLSLLCARGRTSYGCVRRGSSVLLGRFAGFRRIALLVGGVRVLRDRLLWRLTLWRICPNQADESKWCGTNAKTLKRDSCCARASRHTIRENHGVGNSSGCDGYCNVVLRDSGRRRVSSDSRLPTNDSRVAARSDGPTPNRELSGPIPRGPLLVWGRLEPVRPRKSSCVFSRWLLGGR